MRLLLVILSLLILFVCDIKAQAVTDDFVVSPLCDINGTIVCPVGYEAGCADESLKSTEPKCIFYNEKFISGCLKFVGVKKIDINFETLMLSPGSMVKIIGGGETYTLNREIVGCKKL